MKTAYFRQVLKSGTVIYGEKGRILLPDEPTDQATEAIVVKDRGIVLAVFLDIEQVYFLFTLENKDEFIDLLYQEANRIRIMHPLSLLGVRDKDARTLVFQNMILPFVGNRKAIRKLARVLSKSLPNLQVRKPKTLIEKWVRSTPYGVFVGDSFNKVVKASENPAIKEILDREVKRRKNAWRVIPWEGNPQMEGYAPKVRQR